MKTTNILTALIFTFIFFGCEDVIFVDLESSSPRIVLEGFVNDASGDKWLYISKSTDFYNPGVYEKVSGAEVRLANSEGGSEILSEIQQGVYFSSGAPGKPEVKYSITVNNNGKTYEAESTMPEKIEIDSLFIEKNNISSPNSDKIQYDMHIFFQDVKGREDYCRFKIFVNGERIPGIFTYNDRLTDGKYINRRIRIFTEAELPEGSKITAELETIDRRVYEYFKMLANVNASADRERPGQTTPANPVSNWSNNVLGYFSAYTSSVDSIIYKIN